MYQQASFSQAENSTGDTSEVDVAYLWSTPGCGSGEKFLTDAWSWRADREREKAHEDRMLPAAPILIPDWRLFIWRRLIFMGAMRPIG